MLYPVFLVDLESFDQNDFSRVLLVSLHPNRADAHRVADEMGVTDDGVYYVGNPTSENLGVH